MSPSIADPEQPDEALRRARADLTGQRFGRLIALEEAERAPGQKRLWRCRCECGSETVVQQKHLRSGHAASCGCSRRGRVVDLTGQRFGRLVVLGVAGRDAKRNTLWRCRCECGTEAVKLGDRLKAGKTKSCGCLKYTARVLPHDHGQSGKPLYVRWITMIQRTTNPRHKAYPYYGGRGITVCPKWRESFAAFARDMEPGFSPELTLDRIDNDRGYEPGNCRWATRKEQTRNRRVTRHLTFRGQTKPLAEWADLLGVNCELIRDRMDRYGWSVERALTTGAAPDAVAAAAIAAGGDAR